MIDRNWKEEFEGRVAWIRSLLEGSGARGIIFGNSGGKDSALVGILCRAACENTVGIIMPCASRRNYGEDAEDGRALAEQFGIETRTVDLTAVRERELAALEGITELTDLAVANIAPRLRMTTLYTIGQSEGPIADLTATEVFAFLRYLGAPDSIVEKAPSAGLFDGQTDEQEMGVTYSAIDRFLTEGTASEADRKIIDRYHARSEHKRHPIPTYQA